MPVPAPLTNSPRLKTTAILAVAVELLELLLIALQLAVLVIDTAAPIICAPIYLLIYVVESLIGEIGSRQLTNPVQTTTNHASK